MSCTVIAVPYALMWVVGAIASAAATATVNSNADNYNPDIFGLATEDENCEEDRVITDKHFIEKTFATPFMDREILIKTIKEHGMNNISEWENGFSGDVGNYKLIFEKPSADKPYNLKITCLENENADEKASDLNNEYVMNVQEDAYLHIVDKLKENNMQIEEEEVMDDNTIVLTINID